MEAISVEKKKEREATKKNSMGKNRLHKKELFARFRSIASLNVYSDTMKDVTDFQLKSISKAIKVIHAYYLNGTVV